MESPFLVIRAEIDQLVTNRTAVDLFDSIDCGCICVDRDAGTGITVLSDRKRNTCTMHGIAAKDIKDLCIFFTRGTKCSPSCWDVVEEIFDLDDVLSTWT